MSLAEAIEDEQALRERRCIVTGEVLPETALIRFVADPDGRVVPDIAARLPGRGLWVSARRDLLERAVARNYFSKAAKASLTAEGDLAERTERLLVRRMLADLGLARRAGELEIGFDNVQRALEGKTPIAALVEASDGAADGRHKLAAAARAKGLKVPTIDGLSGAELSLALGRENVIHAALKQGRLAQRLVFDAGRLRGLRPHSTLAAAGPNPAGDERQV